MNAVVEKDLEKIKFAIKSDFSITNTKDSDGKTALHLASQNGNMEVVELIINNNFSVTEAKDKEGCTALH